MIKKTRSLSSSSVFRSSGVESPLTAHLSTPDIKSSHHLRKKLKHIERIVRSVKHKIEAQAPKHPDLI